MSNGQRRVSLLTSNFVQETQDNNGTKTLTTTPEPQEATNDRQAKSADDDITTPFNPGFNFEIVPAHSNSWYDDNNVSDVGPGTVAEASNSLASYSDHLKSYGDEILPLTPVQTQSPLQFARSPLPDTPITHDSHASRLRKGHSLLKLQDSAKVGKTHDIRPKSKSRLHRAFSENETSRFDPVHGRRLFDYDDKHRPIKSNPYEEAVESDSESKTTAKSYTLYELETPGDETHRSKKYRILGGIHDEYLPDFDFKEALKRWDESHFNLLNSNSTSLGSSMVESGPSSLHSSNASASLGVLHSQVSPMAVPRRSIEEEEAFIQSQLPEGFESMPFSARRKVISQLSLSANPEVLKKFAQQASRSRSKASLAQQFIHSMSASRSLKSYEEGNSILGYRLGKILGSGAWGLIRECSSGDSVKAMKIIRTKNQAVRSHFAREAVIWKRLKHPYILPLYGVKEEEEAIFCLTEKAHGGNLYDLVMKWGVYGSSSSTTPRNTRLKITREYLLEVISALIYMHSKGIVHGDVKLENCLIDIGPPKRKILLCDFGMSTQFKVIDESDDIVLNDTIIKRRPSIPRSVSGSNVKSIHALSKIVQDKAKVHDDTRFELTHNPSRESSDSDMLSFDASPIEPKSHPMDSGIPDSHIGSLPYAAPELLEACPPPLGPTADIWALGVLLYTMCTGKLPFQHQFEPRLRAMIENGTYDFDAFVEACGHNENFIKVLEGCMMKDMTKRMSLEQAYSLLLSATF